MCIHYQVVDAADVVLQVLDARDPLGCKCPQVMWYCLENTYLFGFLCTINERQHCSGGSRVNNFLEGT